MATEIDICNLALSRLGDSATVASIDPPEGSPQATHCAQFYPLARDTVLDRHTWSFATTRAALAQLSATPVMGWLYVYARPSNAVSIVSLFDAGAANDFAPQEYETESLPDGTEIIYSNTDSAICRYKFQVTDPSKFPPLFVEALSWLLASHLAGPVLKGDKGAAATTKCYQMFEMQLGLAKAADAAQRRVKPEHDVSWMTAR
jgi:hypothetical protein